MKSLLKGYGRGKKLGYTDLDNRLTDGDEVASLMPQPSLTHQED
jgi:hypothetical protein